MQLGRVATLTEKLDIVPEPIRLFRKLSDNGKWPNALMLESTDPVTKKGDRSVIVVRSAVKATCFGTGVHVTALSKNGANAVSFLKQKLDKYLISDEEGGFTALFPKPRRDQNMTDRLLAPSPFDVIRAMARDFELDSAAPNSFFMAAGVFSYDLLDVFENLPRAKVDNHQFPDYVFWLPEALTIIDHRNLHTTVVSHTFGGINSDQQYKNDCKLVKDILQACKEVGPEKEEGDVKGPVGALDISHKEDMDDEEYADLVKKLKQKILQGEVFQIVPSRTFELPCQDPLSAYTRLRKLNPSPYMYYLNEGNFTVFGSSPETFIKVSGDPLTVEVRPIAGTRPRGFDQNGDVDTELDARREADLRLDDKELSEHMMLVDLARNDVARVCKPKSRVVVKLLAVERYSHVMHLVSYVRGELDDRLDALHAYQASMNMGTLIGAPKLKAAEILREVEVSKRGPYGGAVGYLTNSGEMDTAILIRSALVQGSRAYVRAGAGVVVDSVPAAEAAESRNKAQAVLRAICQSEAKG